MQASKLKLSYNKTMAIQNRFNEQNQAVIQLTSAETEKYLNLNVDNPELWQWMQNKGLDFDHGLVEISINGLPAKIQTNKKGFGKISLF